MDEIINALEPPYFLLLTFSTAKTTSSHTKSQSNLGHPRRQIHGLT